ncbi:MAG TPA: S24 family peptidase [Micropepsaceae bacterium]|nr:S24 family peptidase [Micropepsaceae bacterium]
MADPSERDIVDYFDRPPSFADAPNGYATVVPGRSMEPRYHPGEIIYVYPDKAVTAGCYVFVQIRTKTGGEPDPRLIRRLARQTRTKIVLQQFNPAKLSDIAVKDVVCMHRIVGSGE